jgi:hypothetical protein
VSDPKKPQRLSAGKLALSALAPMLPLLLLIWVNRTPNSVAENSVRLTGEWKLMEADGGDLGGPEVDDSGWATIRLPGNLYSEGFEGQHHWLRKTFDWDKDDPSWKGFLMLGNLRYGIAEVFVNGTYVGRNNTLFYDFQPDFGHLAGVEIPPGLLKPGKNVVALKLYWYYTLSAGFYDDRVLLGSAKHLQPYFAQVSTANFYLTTGALFLQVMLGGLLLILLRATSNKEDRLSLKVALFMMASTIVAGW